MKKGLILSAALLATLGAGAQTSKTSTKTAGRISFEKALPNWLMDADGVGDISRLDAYGKPLLLSGNTPEERAQTFINGRLREAGIVPEEWSVAAINATAKFTYVNFGRKIEGREALFSHLRFQFAKNGTLVRLQAAVPQTPVAGVSPKLLPDAVKAAATEKPHGGEVIRDVVMSNDWVWMPETGDDGLSHLQPAYPFTAEGISEDGQTPANYEGYISAMTGKLLLRHNRTRTDLNLTVKGQKQALHPTDPIDTVAFPDLTVRVGSSSFFTDGNGLAVGTGVSLPATVTLPLQGRWSRVYVGGTGGTTPSITVSVLDTNSIVIRNDSINYQNAYYHVTRIHDFAKAQLPSFTGMDVQLPTNVDLTTGSCNAFYNGSSINFYAASGGCQSMTNYADIIYHEYGHGINERFYNQNGARRMYNGALNEAYADVWAMMITKVPIIGEGSTGQGAIIRRYDNVVKRIPVDIKGEVHADGEMIAGSWWHVAKYLGDADSMRPLFIESFYSLADGLVGNEPAIYRGILVSALLADDNDNNLNNGTPHLTQIIRAFADHGIYLGAYTNVVHNEVAHQPASIAITITGTLTTAQPAVFGGAMLFFRPRAVPAVAWDSTGISLLGSNFTATIPGQNAGTVMDYYIRVKNALAPEDVTYYPAGYRPDLSSTESTLAYQFGIGLKPVLTQDFESDTTGWKVGNVAGDNATSGIWTWGTPTASYQTGTGFTSLVIQPGGDHTPSGSKCLFTANFAGVQNGTTTMISPPIDLTGMRTPVIEYYRWFSNNRSSNARTDFWRVQIQNANGGAPFMMDYTKQSDQSWRRRIIRVRDYIGSSISAVRLRFPLSDLATASSSLEGAVDDFVLYDMQDPTAVEDLSLSNIRVYPNPATDMMRVEMDASLPSASIGLYDLQGRLLAEKEVAGQAQLVEFNTSQLASGSYFLRIKTGSVQQVKKVQVLH